MVKPINIVVVRSDYEFSGIKRYMEFFCNSLVDHNRHVKVHLIAHPEYITNWPRGDWDKDVIVPFVTKCYLLVNKVFPRSSNLLGIKGMAKITGVLNRIIFLLLDIQPDYWRTVVNRYLQKNESKFDLIYYCQPAQTDRIVTKKTPVMCLWCDFSEDFNEQYRSRLKESYKYWFEKSDYVVFLTETVRNRAFELYPMMSMNRTGSVSVPPWLKGTSEGAIKTITTKLESTVNSVYAVLPGRLHPRKRQHLVVEAIDQLEKRSPNKIVPVLCGPGTQWLGLDKNSHYEIKYDERYLNLVEKAAHRGNMKWGKDILALGLLSEEELSALYQLSQICIFPSIYEGLGLPIFEAMKSGLPVICSNIPVFRNELEERGLVAHYFEQDNVSSLVRTIAFVLDNWSFVNKQADINRSIISKYTPKKFADDYLELIQWVIDDNDSRGELEISINHSGN